MTWVERPIELAMEKALKKEVEQARSRELLGLYVSARAKILDLIPTIPLVQPDLTDHTAPHLSNVLDNAWKLIGKNESKPDRLSAIELYSLCLAILFHDIGNVYGRDDHERRIGHIYDEIRLNANPPQSEKIAIQRIVEAHGKPTVTSPNPLGILAGPYQIDSTIIRAQELAAILRFADELAEGIQRTSRFRIKHGLMSAESQKYHDYASITQVTIDPVSYRILLTYTIHISCADGEIDSEIEKLESLLEYTYGRIGKLEEERQYTAHYSPHIKKFQSTYVDLTIWVNSQLVVLDLDQSPLILSGLKIPGRETPKIYDIDESYETLLICEQVREAIGKYPPAPQVILAHERVI